MKSQDDIRAALRAWILEHARAGVPPGFHDQTPILESGILSSLDIVEFTLFIEHLRNREVDVDAIEPEAFVDVDSVYATFFEPLAS